MSYGTTPKSDSMEPNRNYFRDQMRCPCCGMGLTLSEANGSIRLEADESRGMMPLAAGTMFIDPHAHMISRTTNDYEAMARAGVVAVIEPSFWLGQPRTSLGSYVDYFSTILGFERFRAGQFGIRHYCCIGLNPKEANNEALAEAVLELLPHFAVKETVVALGELGYDEQTELEDKYLRAQIELAKALDLPIMIHTPHRDKKRGRGYFAAFSIYPNTKMGNERLTEIVRVYGPERIIVDSACDWGISDPLAVPKTAALMAQRGMPAEVIRQVVYHNALAVYGRSGAMKELDWLDPLPKGTASSEEARRPQSRVHVHLSLI
jgi:predicted metal-dependent TIM-barrel fold hydrolase